MPAHRRTGLQSVDRVTADTTRQCLQAVDDYGDATLVSGRPLLLGASRSSRKHFRLTKDERLKALYGHENPPSAQDVIEGRLVQIGLRALELGNNVVIDYGLWGRDERSALRQAAAELGATVEMRYFELTPAEQRTRLDQRQAEAPHTTWPMSDEEIADWAANIDIPTPGELDGSEPIDDPPAGFATWGEWRRHRWPPSVS